MFILLSLVCLLVAIIADNLSRAISTTGKDKTILNVSKVVLFLLGFSGIVVAMFQAI
jgi:hypothetical protein